MPGPPWTQEETETLLQYLATNPSRYRLASGLLDLKTAGRCGAAIVNEKCGTKYTTKQVRDRFSNLRSKFNNKDKSITCYMPYLSVLLADLPTETMTTSAIHSDSDSSSLDPVLSPKSRKNPPGSGSARATLSSTPMEISLPRRTQFPVPPEHNYTSATTPRVDLPIPSSSGFSLHLEPENATEMALVIFQQVHLSSFTRDEERIGILQYLQDEKNARFFLFLESAQLREQWLHSLF